ncbi:MAG TPA: hypothetical protein VFV37_04585 [Luteibaculaceae bacterium]|nr:hypothetical protein [Luteibaculaceae bacterium]
MKTKAKIPWAPRSIQWLKAYRISGPFIVSAYCILLAVAACKKDPLSPEPANPANDTFFTVRFRAIVDTTGLAGFILDREAFFPHLNDIHIYFASFSPEFGNLQPDVYAPPTPMNGSMYRGVVVRWGVYVYRRDSNGYIYDRKYWLLPADTIDSRDDTLYVFRYPEDTARAQRRDWFTRRPL